MPVQNFIGLSSRSNEGYKFGGTFAQGTTPTLLDNAEARRVRWFVENMVFRSTFDINLGTPATNQFLADFSNGEAVKWRLDLQTALRYDREPRLGANLDLRGHDVLFRELSRLVQWGDVGFQFHPQNYPADTDDDLRVILKLFAWDSETPYHVGFKTASASDLEGSGSLDADHGLVWTLPHEDGTVGQVLKTDGNRILGWADAGGCDNFGIISVAGQDDVEADQCGDTLTLIAGTGISLTTNAAADSVTITNTDYGGGTLTVTEQDGTPSVSNVTTIKFDNGTVTDDGSGVVSVTNSGGGAFPITGAEDEIVTLDSSGNPQRAADIKAVGGSGATTKYFHFIDLNNGYDYRVGRVKTGDQGITIDAGSGSVIADFFKSVAGVSNYRTASFGHDTHTLSGSTTTGFNLKNTLDIFGRITIRGTDPSSDDGVFAQIINPHTTGNSGQLQLPNNAREVAKTNALGWTQDADGSNAAAQYFRVFRADGEIALGTGGISTGLHISADSGSSISLGDGQQIDIAGGTDIGTTISSATDIYGNYTHTIQVNYTGGTSDERLKENIQPLKGAAEKVAALRAVEFDWADEKERERTGNVRDFGFLAQEVEKVIPELVRERNDGMKTVNYGGVVPLLLDVIQDLTKRIELLESKAQ